MSRLATPMPTTEPDPRPAPCDSSYLLPAGALASASRPVTERAGGGHHGIAALVAEPEPRIASARHMLASYWVDVKIPAEPIRLSPDGAPTDVGYEACLEPFSIPAMDEAAA